jgi:large conductance mechanosensitive channel
MGMIKEFKEFAVRGNVVDLAVGIIIGAAFGKIVTSFVNDVVMPPLGMMMAGSNVADWGYQIGVADDAEKTAIKINYGLLLQSIIDFVIVAFVIFLVIKGINRMKRKEAVAAAVPAPPPRQEILLEEIRDLLKQR